jgi:hypothetical protein
MNFKICSDFKLFRFLILFQFRFFQILKEQNRNIKEKTEKKKKEKERVPGPRPTGFRRPRVVCGMSTARRFKRGIGVPHMLPCVCVCPFGEMGPSPSYSDAPGRCDLQRQNLYTAFCGAYHRTAYTFYAWSVFWARPIVLFLMQTCSLSSFSFLLFLLCSNFLYFILDLNQLRIYSNFEISKFVKFLRF